MTSQAQCMETPEGNFRLNIYYFSQITTNLSQAFTTPTNSQSQPNSLPKYVQLICYVTRFWSTGIWVRAGYVGKVKVWNANEWESVDNIAILVTLL